MNRNACPYKKKRQLNIEITVLGIQGEQVKLGIVAPKNISVHRKEIFLQIQKENAEAALNSKVDFNSLF